MSDTLFGASLTDEYLAVVEREAPKDWTSAKRVLTNYYRSVTPQAAASSIPATEKTLTAGVQSTNEVQTAAPVTAKKQPAKKNSSSGKAFEKKNNADQSLQCHHCGLMGHKRPDCHFVMVAKASNSAPIVPGQVNQQQQPSQAPFHRTASNTYNPQTAQRGQPRGRRPFPGHGRGRGSAPSTRGGYHNPNWTASVDQDEWDQFQEGQVGPDQFFDPQFQGQFPDY